MKDEIEIVNIMADGTICKDLSMYIDEEHPLPELTQLIMLEIMRVGQKVRAGG